MTDIYILVHPDHAIEDAQQLVDAPQTDSWCYPNIVDEIITRQQQIAQANAQHCDMRIALVCSDEHGLDEDFWDVRFSDDMQLEVVIQDTLEDMAPGAAVVAGLMRDECVEQASDALQRLGWRVKLDEACVMPLSVDSYNENYGHSLGMIELDAVQRGLQMPEMVRWSAAERFVAQVDVWERSGDQLRERVGSYLHEIVGAHQGIDGEVVSSDIAEDGSAMLSHYFQTARTILTSALDGTSEGSHIDEQGVLRAAPGSWDEHHLQMAWERGLLVLCGLRESGQSL